MSKDEIWQLVEALGNIRTVIEAADPQDKAEIYKQLGLHLTYEPNTRLVRAEAGIKPHV